MPPHARLCLRTALVGVALWGAPSCVESIACVDDGDCPVGLVCAEMCVLPTLTVPGEVRRAVSGTFVVVGDGGQHVVRVAGDAGEVVAVSAPAGVFVSVDSSDGDTVIHVESEYAIIADVGVTFSSGVDIDVLLRPSDWQDPHRRNRTVLSLTGPAFAASSAGDTVWIKNDLFPGPHRGPRFFDPEAGPLASHVDVGGITVVRPRGGTLVVYSDTIDGDADDSDVADDVTGTVDDCVSPQDVDAIPTSGVIEALVKLPREPLQDVAVLHLSSVVDVVVDGDVVKVVVRGSDGSGADVVAGSVAGLVGDDAWHSVAVFYSPTGAALVVDDHVSSLLPLPTLGAAGVAVSHTDVCALMVCGEGQGMTPSGRALMVASRNGHVVRAAPQVIHQAFFADVTAVAGHAVAKDISDVFVPSVVIVAARSADDVGIAGLGLAFGRLSTTLTGTAVFVGTGVPDPLIPLTVVGGVADIAVTQVHGVGADTVAVASPQVPAVADGLAVQAPPGALVWVVAEGQGDLRASSPTTAEGLEGLRILTTTPTVPTTSSPTMIHMPFESGDATMAALILAP